MTFAVARWRDLLAHGGFWNIKDMLEIYGQQFLGAFNELAHARNYIKQSSSAAAEPLHPDTSAYLLKLLNNMMRSIFDVGAKSAWVSANRLKLRLENKDESLNFGVAGECLADIESRFVDHLGFVRLYVIPEEKYNLMGGAEFLIGRLAADRFTSARFDCEEAAKCLCLSRATASVFHSMRVTEVGLKALAKRLNIADPTKPAEKNWAVILGKIKDKIEELFPKNNRLPDSIGFSLEAIYANLESIRNPWRNSTMHIETVYTLDEASHIFNCTKALINKMAEVFDENGTEIATPQLPGVGSFGFAEMLTGPSERGA